MKTSRAWCTTRPTWLNMANRSRLGLALRYSLSRATAFINTSKLWVSTWSLNQAASAPNFPLGYTEAASSSFSIWCVCSTVPALPLCHSKSALPSVSQSLVTTAKVFTPFPSLNSSPWVERIRMARYR